MYISFNWIKKFVDLSGLDLQKLSEEITLKSSEIEQVLFQADAFNNMVVGEVVAMEKHPDADKLNIVETNVGDETLKIVCGGSNVKVGMKVAVAKLGAKVKWHGEGELVEMKRVKIRGIESLGMICAASEIGVTGGDEPADGILDISHMNVKAGDELADVFEKNDVIIEVDNKTITHRPDMWGHYGFAREIAAIVKRKFEPKKIKVEYPKVDKNLDIRVENSRLCKRYCAVAIDGIKIGPSPEWLAEKLRVLGHAPHNNIVDITNYVMLELGQPMHAFDRAKTGDVIVVRNAKNGEKIKTLKDEDKELSEEMLVIANEKEAIAVAGVIGGDSSKVDDETTSIILESASFDAVSVRKTSTKIGVRTDSVQRFEKSLDPHFAKQALDRAVELILEICPNAKIVSSVSDIVNFEDKDLILDFDIERAKRKIGIEISKDEIVRILSDLEFEVQSEKGDVLTVKVPSFRATKDIEIEDDLVEEIARMYGYENIKGVLPLLPTKLPVVNVERKIKHKARELFSYAYGFDEVNNYSFYGKDDLEKCLMPDEGHLKLQNYLSNEQTHLRTTFVPNLLKNLQFNRKNYANIRIYEFGHTYKEIGEFYPLEDKYLSGALYFGTEKDHPFYEAKAVVDGFFENFHVKGLKKVYEIVDVPYAHPKQAVTYMTHSGQTVAKVFGLHPLVSQNYGFKKAKIAMFEINFTEAVKLMSAKKKYKKISKFPGVKLDVSVVVDEKMMVEDLENAILKANKALIKEVELFDIYQGENMETGKKSVAFKVLLMDEKRTLTDEDLSGTQEKIFKNLEVMGGIIRGK